MLLQDNALHLVEQRGCAVLGIASPRCNHHCWHLLTTTDTSCRRNPRKTTKKLREVMLFRDNARPHSANLTKSTIQELGWTVIPHPPYWPNLTLSDFHLFRSLSNNLQGTAFSDENVLRTWLGDFKSKPRDLYRRRIEKLLQLWLTVVYSEGDD